MARSPWMFTLILAACDTTSGGLSGPPLTGAEQQQAADLYAEHCAVCHGPDGEGGVGPAMHEDDVAEVADVIENGEDEMDGLGDVMTPDEIDLVARYVVQTWGEDGSGSDDDEADDDDDDSDDDDDDASDDD